MIYPPSKAVRSFQTVAKSGTMAAGLAGASPILAARWAAPNYVMVVKEIKITAATLGTAFAEGGVLFDLFSAKSFTVNDTGGGAIAWTVPNSGALRSGFDQSKFASFGEIRNSATATLTAGTRTLDTNPIASLMGHVGAVPSSILIPPPGHLFDARDPVLQPIEVRNNEGFVIQATVPATGTWQYAITIAWEEWLDTDYLATLGR